ncbi:uncharacterized protein LOC129973031 isoform X2 [Argiope bruennichi]|uniref:uncharacterized protein LOC129973031 isoform X2 n=1 Tax=Argiope bruennichi TaxID=94029 RepID=UPI002495865E|nr:uncharacterized protein LOC129973031 isoform X2 [Argiope bruennichi]
MGKSKNEMPQCNFSTKKESEVVPVDSCPGWLNPCTFCDKRFGDWIEATEENLAKIPTKPGILEIAFKSKNSTEIVSVILDTHDLQKTAYESVDSAKEIIADKKSKVTKTVILCRWVVFKQSNDKNITTLCAHWYNYGVLPKFLKSWPGLDILQKTDSLIYSEKLQKWCYPKKEAFWRKPKQLPTKLVEVVKSCTWTQPCEICDSYFSKWERAEDVIAHDKAPDANGIFMLAICCEQKLEVCEIVFFNDIVLNIRRSLESVYTHKKYLLKRKDYASKNAFLMVRWLELKDPQSDNSCFLYAHWLNSDSRPMYRSVPGVDIVKKNKHFVIRTRDQKWCYEIDTLKQIKTTKFQQKRHIISDLKEDICLNFGDN